MRAYHAYAALAQRELGIVPAAELRLAYEALLEIRPLHAQHAHAAADRPHLEGERLRALWNAATRGHAQLALVTGEAGIGKSRLVEHLRATCRRDVGRGPRLRRRRLDGLRTAGRVAALGRARAAPAPPRPHPRGRAHRLLPELAASPPAAALTAPPPRPPTPPPAAALGAARPPRSPRRRRRGADPRRTRPPAAAPAEPPPRGRPARRGCSPPSRTPLLGTGAPLLLVADDLQYFDAPTLQFLHYLLRSPVPLLVAATARREELDAGHPVIELATGLQALGRCRRSRSGGSRASRRGSSREQLRGAPLDGAEAERLLAASEGNPLYLVEAAQADSVPAGRVQAMIAARLARLSPPAAELAGVAATIGREFSAPVLAEAAGVEDRAFARGLDELWRRGIVRRARARPLRLQPRAHPRGRVRADRPGAAARAASAGRPRARARRHDRSRRAGRAVRGGGSERGRAALVPAGRRRRAATVRPRGRGASARARAGAVRGPAGARAGGPDRAPGAAERARRLPLRSPGARPRPRVRAGGRASASTREPPLVRSRAVAALTAGDFDAARAAAEQTAPRRGAGGAATPIRPARASHRSPAPARDAAAATPPPRARRPPAARPGTSCSSRASRSWRSPPTGAGGSSPPRQHLEAALAHWRPEHRAEHLLRYGQDTELTCRIRLAHTQWLLGDRDAAARTRDAALDGLGAHAHTRAIVHLWAALIALDERDEAGVRAHARVVADHARGPAERPAEALSGFVDVLDGRGEAGVERVRRVVAAAADGRPRGARRARAAGAHPRRGVRARRRPRGGAGRLRARAAHEQPGAAVDRRDRAAEGSLRARGTVPERLVGEACAEPR